MKKFVALALALVLVFALAGCGGAPAASSIEYKIGLVMGPGPLNDGGYNQAAWEGVKAYGDAHDTGYTFYAPEGGTKTDLLVAIGQAVQGGATVVVVAGDVFGEVLQQAPAQYPAVSFIAADVGESDLGGAAPAVNLHCVTFAEEQSGYLAGYAAVKEGLTELGFLGSMAHPGVQRYGSGYVQGISAAAEELGVDVEVKYAYAGQNHGDANVVSKTGGWYQAGMQAVFACGGSVYTSVAEAASAQGGKVIGADLDRQSVAGGEGPYLTSAMKNIKQAVEDDLTTFFEGRFAAVGGRVDVLDVTKGDYVGLPTLDSSWGFAKFTVEEYNTVKEALKSGSRTVSRSFLDQVKPGLSSHVKLMVED